jgi:hypothetical protein
MKSYHVLKFLTLCVSIASINGDAIDDTMQSDMSTLNVRGAGVTFFDAVSTSLTLAVNAKTCHQCVCIMPPPCC